jgi:hypothetical protein
MQAANHKINQAKSCYAGSQTQVKCVEIAWVRLAWATFLTRPRLCKLPITPNMHAWAMTPQAPAHSVLAAIQQHAPAHQLGRSSGCDLPASIDEGPQCVLPPSNSNCSLTFCSDRSAPPCSCTPFICYACSVLLLALVGGWWVWVLCLLTSALQL